MILAFFAVAVTAMLFVGHCAREERKSIERVALVVTTNWLLFASYWIYAPASPAYLIYDAGMAWGVKIPVKLIDVWAVTDLVSLVAVVWIAGRIWWCAIFIATYMAMLTALCVAYATSMDYDNYHYYLDACLIVQIGAILMLGGDGCADYLSRCCGKLRDLVGPARAGDSAFAREDAPR